MSQKSRHPARACSGPLGSRPARSVQIQLSLLLPEADHRVYASAVRNLRRVMGRNAPAIEALIQHELSNRDVAMIVDDYLETQGRRPSRTGGKLRRPGRGEAHGSPVPLPSRSDIQRGPTSDPTRN
jgi:hypothetical protein